MTANARLLVGFVCAAAVALAAVVMLATAPDNTEQQTPTPTTRAVAEQPTLLPTALTEPATNSSIHPTRGPAIQLTEPPAAPTTTIELDNCAEMSAYRAAVGLPARFDAIGYRESGCDNTQISRTGCCVGWLQIHHIIFRDHRTIDGLATCDATWLNIRGDTPEAKQRQMCAAKVLFDVEQYTPWKATT